MVVEAELEPELGRARAAATVSRSASCRAASVDAGGSIQATHEPVDRRAPPSAASSGSSDSTASSDGVAAAGDEPELVEPRAHVAGLVAVQVEELDALVAERGDRAQRAFEVAGAFARARV